MSLTDEVVVYDLFSGPGGVGYALDWLADKFGLNIRHVGVDVTDYGDSYPGEFVRGDASRPPLDPGPDLLWTSPVCLAYLPMSHVNASRYDWDETPKERYPTFEDLRVRGVVADLDPDHYIVENVPTCDDLEPTTRLNGNAFPSVDVKMERHFEASFHVPEARETGRPKVAFGGPHYDGWPVPAIADAKHVPRSWSEQEIRAAIPREYVWYLLSHCPLFDIPEPPVDRQLEIGEVAPVTDGGGYDV